MSDANSWCWLQLRRSEIGKWTSLKWIPIQRSMIVGRPHQRWTVKKIGSSGLRSAVFGAHPPYSGTGGTVHIDGFKEHRADFCQHAGTFGGHLIIWEDLQSVRIALCAALKRCELMKLFRLELCIRLGAWSETNWGRLK
eukprot:2877370-Amphidinium_carterae.1